MNFIDTHSHLYLKDFDPDIDEEIKTSIDLGIKEFYLPSIDSSYTSRMIMLKNKYPDEIKLMMGLHPTHIDTNCEKEIAHVKKMLDEENFSAVGEIGIDLYWNKNNLKKQINIFIQQIEIALSKNPNTPGIEFIENNERTLDECFHIFDIIHKVVVRLETVTRIMKETLEDFANDNVSSNFAML